MTTESDTRTVWDRPDPTTYPALDLFVLFYGVWVTYIGDDGDLILLGHPGELRALAAVRAVWRRDLGFDGADRRLRRWAEPVFTELEYTHARLKDHCDAHSSTDPDCRRCTDIGSYPWWMEYGAEESADTFPVILIRA
jgi:hypothetical protein